MVMINIFLAFFLLLQGSTGKLICEELPVEMCSFSISSSGERCSLETSADRKGEFQCKTSGVLVHGIREHIESDDCITACGPANRKVTGISSDSLYDPIFISKLCSKQCLDNCPNMLDLYSELASAEGLLLSKLCKAQEEKGPEQAMTQLQSNSGMAFGPVSAPAASPLSPSNQT